MELRGAARASKLYRMARLAFEARYSGTHEPFSNSGSRLCDQDLKDFDLSGGIFAMKPV